MAVTQKNNGKWYVHIEKKGMPRVRKTFDTEKIAREFESIYIASHLSKQAATTDNRSLLDLIKIWYRHHGHTLSDGSRRKRALEVLASELKNPIANQLSPDSFLDYRYKRTVSDANKITAKTFNNHHSYLNAVYRHLYKSKVIDYVNPLDGIDPIKIQETQMHYLSLEQIDQVFEALKTRKNKDVWWIAQVCIRTGARWGEAEKLKRKQLHNNRVTYEFTKGKKVRTVQLEPTFFKGLLKHVGTVRNDQRVFINAISAFRRAIDFAGIELPRGQMTHVLRHSFASHFIINGGNILTLKDILGHSDIKMTMRYAHLAPDFASDAVKFNPIANS